jgi:hypothetical protein
MHLAMGLQKIAILILSTTTSYHHAASLVVSYLTFMIDFVRDLFSVAAAVSPPATEVKSSKSIYSIASMGKAGHTHHQSKSVGNNIDPEVWDLVDELVELAVAQVCRELVVD